MSHSSATDPNRLTRGSGYRPPNATKVNYCFHPPGRVPIRRFKRRLNVCGRHQDNKELQIQKALKGKLDRSRWLFSSLFLCYFYIFHLKTTPLPFAATSIHLPRPSILMAIVCLALNRENLQTGSSSATGSSHHAHHNRRESRHEERERSGKKKKLKRNPAHPSLFLDTRPIPAARRPIR